ncbi:hypothetical protein [Actinoplanes regularis]|uniref:Uncharacterized protein n=1 Tax=Actinoplanes regularis TaxID=52697 RepID=A0A239K2L1_9ACTN|nr:hypothetical protein [Actinoplanes regularis]GIE92347.1 hypothetical protein Are01nite_88270 [Actinoplanes regularis]SNT12018.1 hypothetical protein SAMN06264365_14130 [Actinoplanes regularis]
MLILAARDILVSMLADAGVDPDTMTSSDVRTIVDVFRGFAALPVDGVAPPEEDGDGVLAQFGTHDFRGRPEFSADLTRQFVEADDEDAPMWQLSCTLYWAAGAETDGLGFGHLWSFGKTLDEFFAEAGALHGWAWALDGLDAPQDLVITLEAL